MIAKYSDSTFLCPLFTYTVIGGYTTLCSYFSFTTAIISGSTHIYANFPYPN